MIWFAYPNLRAALLLVELEDHHLGAGARDAQCSILRREADVLNGEEVLILAAVGAAVFSTLIASSSSLITAG